MEEIYFETERYCDKFRKAQNCKTMKFYDKLTKSYYLMLSSKFDWLNREIKPNLKSLDETELIYNDYCHIANKINDCLKYKILSQDEKEKLPKLLKSFNKFRDGTRQQYDEN